MEKVKPYGNSMSPYVKLDHDKGGKKVKVTLFRGMISSLLYLTTIRLDIMFSLCMCAHFLSSFKESHLIVVKKKNLDS